MPQMSPMDWLVLMFFFLLMYLMFLVNFYFMIKNNLLMFKNIKKFILNNFFINKWY